jgi:hypothetical protein
LDRHVCLRLRNGRNDLVSTGTDGIEPPTLT